MSRRSRVIKKNPEEINLNKALNELREKYSQYYKENNFNISPTTWNTESSYIKSSFNCDFRGENAYVWQERLGDREKKYQEYYNKIKQIDDEKFLDRTFEDGSYGCITYKIDSILISRDLLDSVFEIIFLKKCFSNLKDFSFLEIGGGYGRLCKRFLDCFPDSKYFITDAIPESTHFSKIYLGKKSDSVIELTDLNERLKNVKINMAINIHSFPECNIMDVEWWIKFIHLKEIKYIFYVPNNPESNPENIKTNSGECILKIFTKYGYKVKYFENLYSQIKLTYSYSVPFFIMDNEKF